MRTQPQLGLRVVRHLILAAVVATLGAADVRAQGGVTESWRDSFLNYIGRRHALDPAGNLLVVGDSRVGGDIIQVRKYSPTGQLLWSRIYDPPQRVRSYWITSDPGGNAWVAAAAIISQNLAVGFRVLKYDPEGNLLFVDSATAGGAACCVVTDSAGNGYLAGNGWTTGAADAYMVVKYAPDGTRLWTGVLDSGSTAFLAAPMSMALSPDETRLVVSGGGSSFTFRALSVAMYDTASGQRLWSYVDTNRYGGTAVAFAPDGASVFVGNTDIATNPTSMGLHKFSVTGNLLFRRSYNDGIAFSRLAVDGASNVVLLGTASSLPSVPGRDWMTVKTNAAGTRLWARRYDGSHTFDEVPDWVTVDGAGAVYVAGMGGPSPSVGNVSVLKTVTAKYDSAGTPIWAAFDGGNTQVTVDDAGGVFTLSSFMTSARFEQTGASDPIPSAPTQLTAAGYFDGVEFRIDLHWTNNATNEFFHAIERCPGATCTNFAVIGHTTGANSGGFRDRPLTSGATYTYRVRALGFTGSSAYSNTVVGATPVISAPAAPSNLVATLSGDSVQLSWTDNSVNEDMFLVERCDGSGCSAFTQIGPADANVTSYVDITILAGQSYSYRVRAWTSGGGYSGYSNVASVAPPLAVPAAPTNLAAIAGKRGRINLTWVNTATNATSITVERCSGSTCTAFSTVAQLLGTATSWTNQGLTSGGTYRYRVYASNAAGSSAHSNIASATAH